MTITEHAALRWQERVDSRLTHDEARAAIMAHQRAIDMAARFGSESVRLGNGARLVLSGDRVVTVLARGQVNVALSFPKAEREKFYARH